MLTRSKAAFAVILVCAALAAYFPSLRGGFLWDDDAHVTRPELRSWHGLWRIWSDPHATQQYYPLTHTVFWIEHRIWGDAPMGYHVVSLALHLCSVGLFFIILCRLRIPGASLAAVIFALHPVHVESVAWITELKNTLSGALYLASAWVYLRFDESRRARCYAAASGLFVLALLSKSVTATLPGALLVILWWNRGRLSWKRDTLPLAPWLAWGACAGSFTAWVERTLIGAQGAPFDLTLGKRCLLAGRVVWFYLGKLLWPARLTFIYPRFEVDAWDGWHWLYPAGVVSLVLATWLMRARWRGPLSALVYFVGTLFPVLGFFNVYPFIFSFVADHFQYLASLGVITLVSATMAISLSRMPQWSRGAAKVAIAVMVLALASSTWRQSRMYGDVETLYRRTIAMNPACWMAHNNLGEVLAGTGRPDEALRHYEEALRLRPDYPDAHNNLGNLLCATGRIDEAILHFEEAIRIRPDFADAMSNLGLAMTREGRWEDAIGVYQKALALEPDHVEAHYNLGIALLVRGKPAEAIGHLERMLRARPNHVDARFNLGSALLLDGRADEAIPQFEQVLRVKPQSAETCFNLGLALESTGRTTEAIDQFVRAIRYRPDYDKAKTALQRARATTAR